MPRARPWVGPRLMVGFPRGSHPVKRLGPPSSEMYCWAPAKGRALKYIWIDTDHFCLNHVPKLGHISKGISESAPGRYLGHIGQAPGHKSVSDNYIHLT